MVDVNSVFKDKGNIEKAKILKCMYGKLGDDNINLYYPKEACGLGYKGLTCDECGMTVDGIARLWSNLSSEGTRLENAKEGLRSMIKYLEDTGDNLTGKTTLEVFDSSGFPPTPKN